jgi:hypothetical protein
MSAGEGGAQKGSSGAWAGVVAENFGDVRECARWSTASVGRAKLTGKAHGAERERGRAHGAMARRLANRAREAEREDGRVGEGNWRRQLGPTGQREREGCGADRRRQAGSACQERQACGRAAGPGGLVCAKLAFSFFLNFLIAFPFFSLGVFNSNSNQVSNSN